MKKKKDRQILEAFGLLTHIGLTMIIPILVCLFVGRFLDQKLHTAPLFLIIFIILGVLSAFRNLFSLTKKFK